ncbi:dynamin family protein [Pseudonocardia bannensis]|uniref:GTP-binding protein n=1 Tax=Pseudonocardia bannensis TaxID=630973 RepID=A0A848DL44_9PSEU|nr:dynamin family protein [Pseudonocardia bannensis]NMH93480.1 GTP-binding protein [Pseudonocardia bannensis]
MSTLMTELRHLLDAAALAFAGTTRGHEIAAVRARLDEPLRIAIAGRVKAGKSTLLNALVGAELAPTDAGECTRVVTWYREGPAPRVLVQPRGGEPQPAAYRQEDGALQVDLAGGSAEDVERILIDWPSAALRPFTLIDTPGIDSVHEDVSCRTARALGAGSRAGVADAVVYLLRHVHSADLNFLEAFSADRSTAPSPVHCVGVLSRADEVGAGRLDAMESGIRVAERYRRDPRLRGLCSTVLPVSALLAQGGATFTEDDAAALAALAGADRTVVDDLLLDATTFAGATPADPGGVGPQVRQHLLDRLGVFGVRLALQLLREGWARGATELGRALVRASGLGDLRQVLLNHLAPRRDLLKARAALRALDDLLREHPEDPAVQALAARLEALTAGAHELAEAGLLSVLRRAELDLSDGEIDAAERVLGAHGPDHTARLGLDPWSAPQVVAAAARAELERWQRRSESPFAGPDTVRAARILVRSCEAVTRQAEQAHASSAG